MNCIQPGLMPLVQLQEYVRRSGMQTFNAGFAIADLETRLGLGLAPVDL